MKIYSHIKKILICYLILSMSILLTNKVYARTKYVWSSNVSTVNTSNIPENQKDSTPQSQTNPLKSYSPVYHNSFH